MLPLARWLAFWLALAGGALTCRTESPSYQPPFLDPRNAAGQARGGPAMGWVPDHTQCRFGQKKDRARKQMRRESSAEETLAVVLVGAKGRSERPERSVRGTFSGEKRCLRCSVLVGVSCLGILAGMMPLLSSPDAGSCGEGGERDLCQNGVEEPAEEEELCRRRDPGTGNNQRR